MDFEKLRNRMVDKQLCARGITDVSMLKAMRRIPRHEFVPENVVNRAYDDCALAIGEDQTISQPYMVALMTQCLDLNKEKRVFEIGTGCGYQTALLAELSKEVYTIERSKVLFDRAQQTLQRLNYTNIKTFCGDGTLGLPEEPQCFDAVMITAASPDRPDYLFSRLTSSGRLVVPIGNRFSQMLMLFIKTDDRIAQEAVCECTFVPLIGEHAWPAY